jgi:hypothetical protein
VFNLGVSSYRIRPKFAVARRAKCEICQRNSFSLQSASALAPACSRRTPLWPLSARRSDIRCLIAWNRRSRIPQKLPCKFESGLLLGKAAQDTTRALTKGVGISLGD